MDYTIDDRLKDLAAMKKYAKKQMAAELTEKLFEHVSFTEELIPYSTTDSHIRLRGELNILKEDTRPNSIKFISKIKGD